MGAVLGGTSCSKYLIDPFKGIQRDQRVRTGHSKDNQLDLLSGSLPFVIQNRDVFLLMLV